jgi:MFS family permease
MQLVGKKIYYGWLVLAAISGINFANAVTSIGMLTVFVLPMSEEFGWNRTQISGATSLGAILGAVAAPIMGRVSDKAGTRVILSAGGFLIVVAMVYLSLMQSLLGFYFAFGMARLSDQGFVQSVSPPAVARWFLRYRGRAMAALFFVTSTGGIVLPLMAQAIIQSWGWREAWAAMAIVMGIVGLLPVLFMIRRQPEDMGLQIDGAASPDLSETTSITGQPDEPSWSLSDALRTPTYWLVLAAVFTTGIAGTGIGLHMVPFLVEQGVGTTAAVGAVSFSFLASAVGSLCWGVLSEKFSPRLLLAAIYVIRAASVGLLLVSDTVVEAYVFALLRGFTEGGVAAVGAILLAEYFGRSNLGAIYGTNRAVLVSGFAVGPIIAGAVYDINESYTLAFGAFLALMLLGAALVAMARPPTKTTAGRSD